MRYLKAIFFAICAGILMFQIGSLLGSFIFDIPFGEFASYIISASNGQIPHSILQYFFSVQSVSIFLVPAIVFLKFADMPIPFFSQVTGLRNELLIGIVFLIGLTIIPAINLLSEINIAIAKSCISSHTLIGMYEQSIEITKYIVRQESTGLLVINIFCIGFIPALTEEVFFRGMLQRLFGKYVNVHLAIWITAFVFSVFHGDVFNFIPRFLLGGILGYMFVLSKSLWVPILSHMLHNSMVVLVNYLIANKVVSESVETFGQTSNYLIVGILSLGLLVFYLVWGIRTYNKKLS